MVDLEGSQHSFFSNYHGEGAQPVTDEGSANGEEPHERGVQDDSKPDDLVRKSRKEIELLEKKNIARVGRTEYVLIRVLEDVGFAQSSKDFLDLYANVFLRQHLRDMQHHFLHKNLDEEYVFVQQRQFFTVLRAEYLFFHLESKLIYRSTLQLSHFTIGEEEIDRKVAAILEEESAEQPELEGQQLRLNRFDAIGKQKLTLHFGLRQKVESGQREAQVARYFEKLYENVVPEQRARTKCLRDRNYHHAVQVTAVRNEHLNRRILCNVLQAKKQVNLHDCFYNLELYNERCQLAESYEYKFYLEDLNFAHHLLLSA